MAERREDNFTLAFRWWMFCYDRIKWVTCQLDSFLWALATLWVQAFTSSVTTRSSKYLSCFKLHDLFIQKQKPSMNWICLTVNMLNSFQRHHISNTVHPEGSNSTTRCSANQSEMLFFSLCCIMFLSERLNKPEERITGLLCSCRTLISFFFTCLCD